MFISSIREGLNLITRYGFRACLLMCLIVSMGIGVCSAQQAPAGLEIIGTLPKLQGPIVATTMGQSPGASTVRLAARRAQVNVDQKDMLTADELEAGKYKALIITMGTSLKGMGGAGVDIDSEVNRVNALIARAKKLGVFIIGAQIEGSSRRTDEYDEKSNRTVAPNSNLLIVRKEVDTDGYFTTVAKQKNIPIVLTKEAVDFGYVLNLIFQAQK